MRGTALRRAVRAAVLALGIGVAAGLALALSAPPVRDAALPAAWAAGAALAVMLGWLAAEVVRLRRAGTVLAGRTVVLQAALDHMGQGLIMVDADHRVVVHNRRALEMLDLPAPLLAARPAFDAVVAHQRAAGEFPDGDRLRLATIVYDQPHAYERRRPDGRILEVHSVPLPGGGMVRTYTDVTERRLAEERVRYFAHYDDLTKLENRVAFRERLDQAMALADGTGRSVAVLYLDLDRFKAVNDTRGHAGGDALLAQVGTRVRAAVRDTDTVARMGGDEFAIIQPLVEQPASAAALAGRVIQAVGQPYVVGGGACTVGVSVGIALYPDHAADAASLLRGADAALYRAKRGGGGVARVFDPDLDAREPAHPPAG